MAKKKKQSLTERLSALINRVGEKPEPTFGYIKSELVDCLGLAEPLEDGAAIREAEEKIARLGEANEALKAAIEAEREELNAEKEYLKVQVLEANYDIDRFRKEEKEREAEEKEREAEEKKRELPDIQFKILQRLPTEHIGDDATLERISRRARIPPGEAAVHLNRLEKAGFAKHRSHYVDPVGTIATWHRTIAGDELVLAKHLAGEEEEQPHRKHANRTKIEEEVMQALAHVGDMTCDDLDSNTKISADQAEVALYDLEKAGLLKIVEPAENDEPAKYGLSVEGVRYMLERGYLS